MKELIKKLFLENSLDINDEKALKFDEFYRFLVQKNEKINLTRIIEREDVAKKHFLDSISAKNFIPQNSKIIDIGAGAGFPSIPLKIMRDDLSFTLIDSVNKKVDFLNSATNMLDLNNIIAIHARAEDLAHENNYREQFDICVARAVAELNILIEYCLPFLKPNGMLIAYKSERAQEEINNAQKALNALNAKIEKIYEYKIEDDRKNCLVIIRKQGRNSNQYPRRGNKPRKEPLI